MSSEGSLPEGGLPVLSSDGGAEMSPRDSLDTSAAAGGHPPAASAPGHRRNSVGAHVTPSMTQRPLESAGVWLCGCHAPSSGATK